MSDTVTRTGVVIARYDSATPSSRALTYLSSVPGDTALRPVSTNSVSLTVQRVPVDSAGQTRDLKPRHVHPVYARRDPHLRRGAPGTGGWGIRRVPVLRKKRQTPGGDTRLPVRGRRTWSRMKQLAALKEKRLWQQGQVKEYYSELTEILRRYFENRFGLMALEETTDEIIEGLRRMKLLPRIIGDVEDVLVRADLVKFAKYKPEIGEHDASLKTVYDIVERRAHLGPGQPRPAALSPRCVRQTPTAPSGARTRRAGTASP